MERAGEGPTTRIAVTDVPDYRASRVQLVEQARKIASDLKQAGGKECEDAQSCVRVLEKTTKKSGDLGDLPVTAEVGKIVGKASETAANHLQALAETMNSEEEWSKVDAERRLAHLQGAQVEVESYPVRSWTKFIAGLGSTHLVSGSAIFSVAEARVWPSIVGPSSWSLAVPSVVLWIAGLVFLVAALWFWSADDAAKLDRYHAEFGGAKVTASRRTVMVSKEVLHEVKVVSSLPGSGTSPGRFIAEAIREKLDRRKKDHTMWSPPAKEPR